MSENPDSDIILAAANALSTSIMSRRLSERASSINSTRSYLTALQMMREELGTAKKSSDRELLASIMCLSLAEVSSAPVSRFNERFAYDA